MNWFFPYLYFPSGPIHRVIVATPFGGLSLNFIDVMIWCILVIGMWWIWSGRHRNGIHDEEAQPKYASRSPKVTRMETGEENEMEYFWVDEGETVLYVHAK